MLAFLSPFPSSPRLAHHHSTRPTRPTCRPRRRPPVATVSPPEDDVRVRFNRDLKDEPKRTFMPESVSPTLSDSPTPNERVLAQVRDSMRRLGVVDSDSSSSAPPPSFVPIDISRVNPLSAYAGATGAALISYVAWNVLNYVVHFFYAHPLTDDFYVVQRLGAVVRTALVCIFALGSGISGVTSLGLLLLGARTTVAAFTGEFRDADKNSQQ